MIYENEQGVHFKIDENLSKLDDVNHSNRKRILGYYLTKGKVVIKKQLEEGDLFILLQKIMHFKKPDLRFAEACQEDVEISKNLNNEYVVYVKH